MENSQQNNNADLPYWARLEGMTPEEYDRKMLESGRSHFDSNGDWVELDHMSETPGWAYGLQFLLFIFGISWKVALFAGSVFGLGLLMGWWRLP